MSDSTSDAVFNSLAAELKTAKPNSLIALATRVDQLEAGNKQLRADLNAAADATGKLQ